MRIIRRRDRRSHRQHHGQGTGRRGRAGHCNADGVLYRGCASSLSSGADELRLLCVFHRVSSIGLGVCIHGGCHHIDVGHRSGIRGVRLLGLDQGGCTRACAMRRRPPAVSHAAKHVPVPHAIPVVLRTDQPRIGGTITPRRRYPAAYRGRLERVAMEHNQPHRCDAPAGIGTRCPSKARWKAAPRPNARLSIGSQPRRRFMMCDVHCIDLIQKHAFMPFYLIRRVIMCDAH